MESLGSLVDKLTIEVNRFQQLHDTDVGNDVLDSVTRQIKKLEEDIELYICLAQMGEVDFEEPKNKNYKGETEKLAKAESLSDAISMLAGSNVTLWNLEDARRDKSLPDSQRLVVCDQVSKWNKQRNHYIDEVNRIFKELFT